MGTYLLERIPNQALTKEQHDRYVEARGRSFTDDHVKPHLTQRNIDGGIVPGPRPSTRKS